jgi:hypothetical protein
VVSAVADFSGMTRTAIARNAARSMSGTSH